MGKKHLSERNLGFETLQLHVGQEEAGSGYRCESSADLRNLFLCIP